MPENKNTLLPCPFCRASLVSNDLGPWWVHQHNGCFLVGKVSLRKQDIKAWNTRTPTPAVEGDETPTKPVVSQNAPDVGHKPAAPQTGYSWTNSAPQGAPETIYGWLDMNDQWYYSPIDPQHHRDATAYTLKSTSDARIAALQAERDEDANQLDSARHTVDVLTARIAELEAGNRQLAARGLLMLDELATARNQTLEEAMAAVHLGYLPIEYIMGGSNAESYREGRLDAIASIRALKTPEEDE